MAADFRIEHAEEGGGVHVLRLHGRLDAANAHSFVVRCRRLLADGARALVVNLAGVDFVASSGIGVLLALTEESREAGGALRLVSPSDAVRSVLDLLNLTQFLTIVETEPEAVRGPVA